MASTDTQTHRSTVSASRKSGPLYKWLADEIRQQIREQKLGPGSPLEPEIELAARYQVSRGTVRQTMATLVNEGLIDRQAGRGSFIRATPPRLSDDPSPTDHPWVGLNQKVSRIRALVDCSFQPAPSHFILTESIDGLSRAVKQLNGACQLTFEYHHVEHAQDPGAHEFMNQDGCEGMIILPTGQGCIDFINQMGNPAKPTAVLYRRITNPHVHRFSIDNSHGAYQGTDYLLRMGHHRIGLLILTWPDSWPSTLERMEGYRRAMCEVGCEDANLVTSAFSSKSPGEVRAACKRLFEQDNPPTALLVNNRANLKPALQALDELNLRVPEDVSVLAFDESQLAQQHDPQISVIHMPLADHAANALEHLHHAIVTQQPPSDERLGYPEIRLRQSCRPLTPLDHLK